MSKHKARGKATIQKRRCDDKPSQVYGSSFQRHLLELLISLGLILIIFAAFWQVRNNESINLDVDLYVTDKPHIQEGLAFRGVLWAFTRVYAGHWHPIAWLSHMFDYNLYGLNPGAHHMASLIFHDR